MITEIDHRDVSHVKNFTETVVKLKLFSFDKRSVLLEKELKNERELVFMGGTSVFDSAYQILMNEIFKDSVDFFRSEEFKKALERLS